MKLGFDETLLTAYALGELEGAERTSVESRLLFDESARQYVADVRQLAGLLTEKLSSQDDAGLTALQHAVIDRELRHGLRIQWAQMSSRRSIGRGTALRIAAAAAVLLGFGVLGSYVHDRITIRQIAKQDASQHPSMTQPAQGPIATDGLPGHGDAPEPLRSLSPDLAANDTAADPESWGPPPDNRFLALYGDPKSPTAEAPLIGPVAGNDPRRPIPPVLTVRGGPRAPAVSDSAGPLAQDTHPAIPGSQSTFMSLPPTRVAPGKTVDSLPHLVENAPVSAAEAPFSAFPADVGSVSYANIRRFLNHNQLPPPDAVRIEEMVNYFPPAPAATDAPIAVETETGPCPWRLDHRLTRVVVQARELPPEKRPAINLVFAIDISRPMQADNKLGAMKKAMRYIAGKLGPRDRFAIVTFTGGTSAVALSPTIGEEKGVIWAAIDHLGTARAADKTPALSLAYDVATRSLLRGGINRVILATDGNWREAGDVPGGADHLVTDKARAGVSLGVLGVGMGSLKDATMEYLATLGGGPSAYVDTPAEARQVLLDQVSGAAIAVAQNVTLQVRFNPDAVNTYRLVGFERRQGSGAEETHPVPGELGAGQSVTALYEIEPANKNSPATRPSELLTVDVHYREPGTAIDRDTQAVAEDTGLTLPRTSGDFRFAAAVAEFGLILRASENKGTGTLSQVLSLAEEGRSADETGYRREFLDLVRKARTLSQSH